MSGADHTIAPASAGAGAHGSGPGPPSATGAGGLPGSAGGPQDILASGEAGGRVIRGSAARALANAAGIAVGVGTAALLLQHLKVAGSGDYVVVMSLVAIPGAVAENGLNIAGSRQLALAPVQKRRELIANILAQRLAITPIGIALAFVFALAAGYSRQMVAGTLLAGTGVFLVVAANALLLRLTVELRNAGLAAVDFVRQVVTLVGVAALVVLGASLTPFFAVQIVVGVVVLALVRPLVGAGALVMPRLDRHTQRALLAKALPIAAAVVVGQLYFRFVIVLMSLISNPIQTGYFAGSLRAMEALAGVPLLVAGVALPLLAAAARDDPARLRYAVRGLGEGAVVAGVLVSLVAVRAAEPVMVLIARSEFGPAGAVLRIQVVSLLFIGLYQVWTAALIALDRQRELIFTNALALLGVSALAAVLVPVLGARGGALAGVLGDALLAALIYWRLHRATGRVFVGAGFLARVLIAGALASGALFIPGLPGLAAAALAGALFLGIGQLIGMIPPEVTAALRLGASLHGGLAPPGRRVS